MRKKLLLLSLVVVACSCHFKKHSPYKGFVWYNDDVYYKYADLGVKHEAMAPGKIMEIAVTYARMNDSVFWRSKGLWYPFTVFLPYDSLEKSSSYPQMLLKCNEGDSVNFIVRKSLLVNSGFKFPCKVADSVVKINVRVISILNLNQFSAKINKYALLGRDKEMKEECELTRYLTLNNIPDSDKKGGIYFIPLVKGTGPKVSEGASVSISYRGYFMNHKTFDSIPANDPLDFVIGNTGQVLEGLEAGIKKMREGDVAKIIIPSRSAYGEKGSSTGIVPPYTTLVFEVTMLKVKEAQKIN